MNEAIVRELASMRRRLEAQETIERGRFAARAYNSADISIATSGLPQALTFDSEEYDYGGLHSVASNTGRLTAAVGGIYAISGHATFASDATGIRQLSIRKNGASALWYDAVPGCIAAYSPIDAASYAASKVNLKNPGTYDASDGAAFPTWAAGTGWTFAGGSSQYLDTGITPAAFDNTWSMFVLYSGGGTSGQSPLLSAGAYDSTMYFDVWSSDFGANRFFGIGNKSTHGAGKVAAGWIGIAGVKCWFDGALDATLDTATVTTATGQTIRVGQEATKGWYYTGNIQRIWIANSAISDSAVATLYGAMTDLTYPAIAHQSTTAISGAATRLSVSTTEYLAAGDYVELLAYQSSGGALDVDYEDACSPYFTMAMV